LKELYKGLIESLGQFARSWLAPSVIGVGLAALTLFPAVHRRDPFRTVDGYSATDQVIVAGSIALVLALLLAALQTPMYRVLEGYHLRPNWLRQRMTARHKRKRAQLKDQAATAPPATRGSLRESIELYPRAPAHVMPTKLGNALRAAETYGKAEYGLDVVALWTRITAVASDALREQVNQARSVMDFFVGTVWLSAVFAVAAGFTAIYGHHVGQWLYVPFAILVGLLAYEQAVSATVWYRESIRATVDLTRAALGSQLGLDVPPRHEDECKLWTALSAFMTWGPYWGDSESWIATLDESRIRYQQMAQSNQCKAPSDEPTPA
jgi:hypothetical protein